MPTQTIDEGRSLQLELIHQISWSTKTERHKHRLFGKLMAKNITVIYQAPDSVT